MAQSMRDNQNGKFAVYSSAEGKRLHIFIPFTERSVLVPYATVAVGNGQQ